MKRNIECSTKSLKKSRFDNYLDENNIIFSRSELKKSNSINNLDNFYYEHSSYELGTKLGLIVASNLLNKFKNNGPEFTNYYFNTYHHQNINKHIDKFISNSSIHNYKELLQDKSIFEQYINFFNDGFKLSFIKFLKLNLKNYPLIIQRLNEFE